MFGNSRMEWSYSFLSDCSGCGVGVDIRQSGVMIQAKCMGGDFHGLGLK